MLGLGMRRKYDVFSFLLPLAVGNTLLAVRITPTRLRASVLQHTPAVCLHIERDR